LLPTERTRRCPPGAGIPQQHRRGGAGRGYRPDRSFQPAVGLPAPSVLKIAVDTAGDRACRLDRGSGRGGEAHYRHRPVADSAGKPACLPAVEAAAGYRPVIQGPDPTVVDHVAV
jgi:hypothetical protein